MLGQLARLLLPTPERRRAHALYLALVEQSRNPYFYTDLGVPDTLDGRFELILLHAFLTLKRLKAEHGGHFDANESGFERELIEVLFEDMDRSLREIGVGDMGVSRRMKAMANAFYGRLSAYEAGGDPAAMEGALERNLYGTAPAESAVLARMRSYMMLSEQTLAAQKIEAITRAEIAFPDPTGL